MNRPDESAYAAIEAMWRGRAKEQSLKPGTKTYAKQELEFFTGAMAALNAVFPNEKPDQLSAAVPVRWVINALSGRPIAPEIKPPVHRQMSQNELNAMADARRGNE